MMLIGHLQKGDATMPILQVARAAVQQQVGISMPVLESNYSKYSFLAENGWIKHVWKFLDDISGSIVVENTWLPTSVYANGDMIMDRVMDILLPQSIILKFNLCRLYNRVYFVTDMLDSKHKRMHPRIL